MKTTLKYLGAIILPPIVFCLAYALEIFLVALWVPSGVITKIITEVVANFIAPIAAVAIADYIAPNHKRAFSTFWAIAFLVLCIVSIWVAISQNTPSSEDYMFYVGTGASSIGCIVALYSIYKQEKLL